MYIYWINIVKITLQIWSKNHLLNPRMLVCPYLLLWSLPALLLLFFLSWAFLFLSLLAQLILAGIELYELGRITCLVHLVDASIFWSDSNFWLLYCERSSMSMFSKFESFEFLYSIYSLDGASHVVSSVAWRNVVWSKL